MNFTPLLVFIVHIFYCHVEASSREISYPESYPLGTLLGNGAKRNHIYHVSPFQELLSVTEVTESQPVTDNNHPTKVKRKKKLKRKNRRNNAVTQIPNRKSGKKKVINRRIKKKFKRKKKFAKATVRRQDQSSGMGSLETVTSDVRINKSRKPVDIVVHIKMQD